MTEIWRDIDGYEGLYQVSNLGRVRSLDKGEKLPNGYRIRKGKILKPGLNRYGYQFVYLYKDGKAKMHTVHKLVAQAFISNPQHFKEINHIDEVKTDNRASNLEWCDRSYNINFGSRNERISKAKKGKPNIGVKIALSKRVAQIDKNSNEVIKIWNSMQECQRHGFSQGNISQCCRNCYYGSNIYKGYKWQYVEDSI